MKRHYEDTSIGLHSLNNYDSEVLSKLKYSKNLLAQMQAINYAVNLAAYGKNYFENNPKEEEKHNPDKEDILSVTDEENSIHEDKSDLGSEEGVPNLDEEDKSVTDEENSIHEDESDHGSEEEESEPDVPQNIKDLTEEVEGHHDKINLLFELLKQSEINSNKDREEWNERFCQFEKNATNRFYHLLEAVTNCEAKIGSIQKKLDRVTKKCSLLESYASSLEKVIHSHEEKINLLKKICAVHIRGLTKQVKKFKNINMKNF
uniref:Uncharacterized protein n=1 Tax=viral metagenome TaxID=1070528 RepID=A0A6C0H7L5_9ZZZZ